VIGKFSALIASAGEAAVSDSEKIERHGVTRRMKAAPGLGDPKDIRSVNSRIRDRSIRESTGFMLVASLQRRVRTHSLSVIRIRPSPVTTIPFAVTAT
jgi:hypothetical protein